MTQHAGDEGPRHDSARTFKQPCLAGQGHAIEEGENLAAGGMHRAQSVASSGIALDQLVQVRSISGMPSRHDQHVGTPNPHSLPLVAAGRAT